MHVRGPVRDPADAPGTSHPDAGRSAGAQAERRVRLHDGSQEGNVTYQELADLLRYPEDPARQELYVQTFEFNPACTLELGWHLFGENYERGEFLVRMREQLRRHGIAESNELPDHLTL